MDYSGPTLSVSARERYREMIPETENIQEKCLSGLDCTAGLGWSESLLNAESTMLVFLLFDSYVLNNSGRVSVTQVTFFSNSDQQIPRQIYLFSLYPRWTNVVECHLNTISTSVRCNQTTDFREDVVSFKIFSCLLFQPISFLKIITEVTTV